MSAQAPTGVVSTAGSVAGLRGSVSAGLVALDTGYVVLASALAVALAWPIYQDARVWLVGAVGIAVVVLVVLGGRWLRLPWWSELLAAIALYFLVAVPVAIPSDFPDHWFEGLRAAAVGVVTGWKDTLTLAPPLGSYQAVLVPLLIVVLFGGFAALRVATSARRARLVAAVVLLAMLAFGIGFGLGAQGANEPYAAAWLPTLPWPGTLTVGEAVIAAVVCFVVLSLLWLVLRARLERTEAVARAAGIAQAGISARRGSAWAGVRRGGAAVAMIAVALLVAGVVAVPAVTASRTVARDHVAPIETITRQPSPLSGYRDWMSDARFDAELFTVVAPAEVDRLRLAVLDAYDGTRFTISSLADGSRFARTASRIDGSGAPVTVTVGDAYTAPWVPLPGDVSGPAAFPGGGDRARELEDTLFYATDASLAAVLADRGDGSVGLRVGDVVTAYGQPQPDARARLASARGGDPLAGVTSERYPSLAAWVDAQGVPADGAGLLTLIDRLRSRGYLSHAYTSGDGSLWERALAAAEGGYRFEPSRAGHSVQRLEALFDQLLEREREVAGAGGGATDADLVAAIGDDEQFAAAAALLAWSQGFPARVVVGVRLAGPEEQSIAAGVPACAPTPAGFDCRGRNVAAWIEVGVGGSWLPVDTSPQFAVPPERIEEGENPPEHGTLPERPASNVIDPPDAPKSEGEPTRPDAVESDAGLTLGAIQALRIAAVVAAGAGLVLVPPAIILVAKWLRRSRRKAAEPEVSIVGAWEEFVDEAVDLGLLPVAAGGTRSQIASRLDDPVARQLAAAADRAVFAPTAPGESDSALVWRMLGEHSARLRRETPLRVRIRGMLNLASFVRHLRPTSARVTVGSEGAGR